jgi:uncharacterized protein YkwD
MRLPAIILASILAVSSAALPVAADGRSTSSASVASSFGDALNVLRAQNGRGALRSDPHLTRAAQAYAEDMARHGYFSHTGRDGSNVMTRARRAGCNGRGYYAENIAWGQRTAQDAFSGWAASSGHRTNMLGRNYGAFGLGQASGYWVLIFSDGC